MGEMCGVEGSSGKTAQGGSEGFGGEGRERAEFPALNGFGEKRGAGDGGSAAAAEEADFADGTVFYCGGEMKDVAANGIADFDLGVGVWKFPGVAGMLEVVEQDLSEHIPEYRSGEGEVSREGSRDL